MSNIYIQEPPTSGKVLLKTSVGDIDVELWCREAPKACRNFIQLCMEGYYDKTIFHRVVKEFIVQGGDPNGDGTGGESIYGEPFKDEFHSRLRFARRGLLAMANGGKDDNGSQFFFTLGPAQELQNKHTIFGKVAGDTIYNMLKLADGDVDHNERPFYPHKINKTEILSNPFDDIVPRENSSKSKKAKDEKKSKRSGGVKNFGLLSFGAEAENDEEETNEFVSKIAGKSKSTHDVLEDPKLSKTPIELPESSKSGKKRSASSDDNKSDDEEKRERAKDRVKEKLKSKSHDNKESKHSESKKSRVKESDDDDDDLSDYFEKEKERKRKQESQKIQDEIKKLKKDYQKDKKERTKVQEEVEIAREAKSKNPLMEDMIKEQEKYSKMSQDIPKKGADREAFTLALLQKFKKKLNTVKDNSSDEPMTQETNVEEDIDGDAWLTHNLRFEEQGPILAKDAVTKQDDWYDVYDPRNPINKRRRGEKPK